MDENETQSGRGGVNRKGRRKPLQQPVSSAEVNDPKVSTSALSRHPIVVGLVTTIVGGVVLACLIWVGHEVSSVFSRLEALEANVGKLKQAVADGGVHDIVSELKKAGNPSIVAARMSLVSAQIAISKSEGKAPDRLKIDELVPAVVDAAKRYPEVPEAWSAVSSLASYRTSAVALPRQEETGSLSDCNLERGKEIIYPEHLGFPIVEGSFGYLFQNCKLYLDRLPGHGKSFDVLPNPTASTEELRRGGRASMGYTAYAKNVVIVWGGTLADTDVIRLFTLNCRFEFAVTSVPSKRAQNLLIAALQDVRPGSGIFDVSSDGNSAAKN